jgi:integrase
MGRTPTRNKYLPRGMRARHRGDTTYYFLDTGAKPRREIPLGKDYVEAVRRWGELTLEPVQVGEAITFRQVAERYVKDVLPSKAPATREINLRELANLLRMFDAPPMQLDMIDPVDVRKYMDWRVSSLVRATHDENVARTASGKPTRLISPTLGQVPANREKALLSHIWNYAREKGITSKANPCAGIKGYREDGRDVYIDDAVFQAVYAVAETPLQDALDLAYLIGQRPADVLKLARADVKDGALWLEQNKTGKKLRVAIEGQLADLMERIGRRKVAGLKLISMADGSPMTKYELRGAFTRARILAADAHPALADDIKNFQFRDLRAKAGTDTEESSGMQAAQDQLGHTTQAMTSHYVRHRRGKLVKPTK